MTIHFNTSKGPEMTPVTVDYSDNKEAEVMPTTQYCGEHYDKKHAWKDILAEQQEYMELLTLQNEIINTGIISHDIPNIPCIPKTNIPLTTPPNSQGPKITKKYIQYTTYYPTPQKATETKQHTKPAHTTYHILIQSEQEYQEEVPSSNSIITTL